MQNTHRNNLNSIFLQQTSIYALLLDIFWGWHKLEIVAFSTYDTIGEFNVDSKAEYTA